MGIAIALAKNATAILMDEPTSGLDPQASNEFSQLVKMLGQQRTTVLMATHDLYRAKDIGIMGQGLCRIRQTWRCESLGTRSDRASNHAVSIEFLLRRNPARHFSLGVTTSFDDVDVTEAPGKTANDRSVDVTEVGETRVPRDVDCYSTFLV